MKIEHFEDIIAWQQARKLAKFLFLIFKDSKDYGFKDQILRAVVSILNNIAEGFERNSDKELKQFLYISKGSCGEVRSMIYLAADFGYMADTQFAEGFAHCQEISRMLSGFIKKL